MVSRSEVFGVKVDWLLESPHERVEPDIPCLRGHTRGLRHRLLPLWVVLDPRAPLALFPEPRMISSSPDQKIPSPSGRFLPRRT